MHGMYNNGEIAFNRSLIQLYTAKDELQYVATTVDTGCTIYMLLYKQCRGFYCCSKRVVNARSVFL